MRQIAESIKRNYQAGKLTADQISNMACLTEDEKAEILTAPVADDYETAYKIVTGEVE